MPTNLLTLALRLNRRLALILNLLRLNLARSPATRCCLCSVGSLVAPKLVAEDRILVLVLRHGPQSRFSPWCCGYRIRGCAATRTVGLVGAAGGTLVSRPVFITGSKLGSVAKKGFSSFSGSLSCMWCSQPCHSEGIVAGS